MRFDSVELTAVRRLAILTAVALLSTILAQVAQANTGENTVYLESDSQGRYLPSVDNDGTSRVLANIDSITPPALAPSGTRVAFAGVLGDGSQGRYGIYLVDTTGSNLVQVTSGAFAEFDPVWVNNGQSLIFAQNTTGSLSASNCCRLVSLNVNTLQTSVLTGNVGAQRPAAAPNGSYVFFDNPSGVLRMRVGGGSATLIAPEGYDATVAPNESAIAYLLRSGNTTQLRGIGSSGGSSTLLYSTSSNLENPVWVAERIYFLEYSGIGYDGRRSVTLRSVLSSGGGVRTERTFWDGVVGVTPRKKGDQILFYRADGLFRYYDIRPDGTLPSPLLGGSNYTKGWSSIVSVDLNGDGQDAMLFYREDGLFRYYRIRSDASLPKPLSAGSGYTRGWDSIVSVDLDGDGRDEMFFYREDGLYRYYRIRSDGTLPSPFRAGSDYTRGWDAITAIDLNGDGRDALFFYRSDGLYRFYNVRPDGTLPSPIRAGTNFEQGLAGITAIDLNGDGRDELLLYRSDGSYEYRRVTPSGELGAVIQSGNNYTSGWTIITSLRLPPP